MTDVTERPTALDKWNAMTPESHADRKVREARGNLSAAERYAELVQTAKQTVKAENPDADQFFLNRLGYRTDSPHEMVRTARRDLGKAEANRDGESAARNAILRHTDYGMFTAAGNRAVRSRLATIAKRAHTGKIRNRHELSAAIRAMMTEIASNKTPMSEVSDTAVREVICEFLDQIAADEWASQYDGYYEWDL